MRALHLSKAGLLLLLAAAPLVGAQTAPDRGDVSPYRRFLIYPHQQRGHAAMKAGDEKTAIAEFQRARELAPYSVRTALDLSEAYRHFGHAARADAVLAAQRLVTPNDPQLLAMQAAAKPVAPDCQHDSGAGCRALRGYDALRAGKLADAEAELADATFARGRDGVALRRALAQRAIYLGDSARADAQFAALERTGQIDADERAQWFSLLLQRHDPARAQHLLEDGGHGAPEQQLALAYAWADRGDMDALGAYLQRAHPPFVQEAQEREWLQLLARCYRTRPRLLIDYRPLIRANRQVRAGLLLSRAMASEHFTEAGAALAQLPASSFREERFTLALYERRFEDALIQAQAMRDGNPALIDPLSYRLVEAGAATQAARLLLASYPYDGDPQAEPLLGRLALLAAREPAAFSAADRERLRVPQSAAQLRGAQAQVLAALQDCEGIGHVLGDLSPAYSADRWAMLGDCYRESRPGVAEYAYAEASRRAPGTVYTRALAYQAYAAEDYPAALAAWREVDSAIMQPADLRAAATTALALGERAAARSWLDAYANRGGTEDDGYWWLRAQAEERGDTERTLADLQRAIAARADPRYYQRQAELQREQGEPEAALYSLQRAAALAPDDASLAAALGYAYLQAGQPAAAVEPFERAHRAHPDDPALVRQLLYLQLQLGRRDEARGYAERAIDQIGMGGGGDAQDLERTRFALQRMHEDLGRRWRFNGDLALGDSVSSGANAIAPGLSYRSYAQFEAQYRFDPALTGGDENTLAAYARVFAGSGAQGDWQPVHAPRLGVGFHWKPWRTQTVLFSVEQQLPLDHTAGNDGDTLLRASGSWYGSERFSDDWHPAQRGWFAQNIYLDVARYLRARQSVFTADYQWGYHRKLNGAQTLEPYVRLQFTGLDRPHGAGFGRDARVGVGVRWNLWYGQTRYDAFPRRIRLGLEWQYAFTSYLHETQAIFLTFGGQW